MIHYRKSDNTIGEFYSDRLYSIDVKDKLCTFVEHIAIQIANICSKPNAKLFITGGGAYNRFLIERLHNYLPTTEVVIPDDDVTLLKSTLSFGVTFGQAKLSLLS